ncbi:beta-N-acetylhexosaminidase [Stackebrandtia soli]|uniref:beta-N-acetylhexosaminidase n=1 Tax=Stackebrandtia soli TaxID=1892856 RepID=UPI0039E94FD1
MTPDLILLPHPRQLTYGGDGPAADTPVSCVVDDELPEQGFELDLGATVTLRHRDPAGLRYGLALLDQIRAQSTERLPGLNIRDWPDFGIRGYMLDISRGRVPARATLERLVDVLALVRVNQLQLYTEHTFAYTDHERVWREASPLTAADIAWLDAECAARGIELVANQNSFGHMEHWLKHPEYRDRAESPDGFELFGAHRNASTLAATEDNAEFALGLLDELLGHFTSRTVNIGCDEPWEFGKGASAAAVAERGRGAVYVEHLNRLIRPLLAKGLDVQFWGDIIAHYPELVPQLPDGATAVAWTYEAPRDPSDPMPWPETNLDAFRAAGLNPDDLTAGFTRTAQAFIEAGYPFWVAPGTSTWLSLVGRIDNARANLRDAAQVGAASGATGYLITDWGDHGHLQPPSVSVPAVAYGAAVAWCLDTNAELPLARAVDAHVFGDSSGRLGATLEKIGTAWGRTGLHAFNASPLQQALTGAGLSVFGDIDTDGVRAVVADLDDALVVLDGLDLTAPDGDAVIAELRAAIRLARHGALRLLVRADESAADSAALRADLAESIDLHSDAWDARSRSGGKEIGMSALAATLAEYA